MSSKNKGTRYERELMHMFYNSGFSVVRSAGSGSTPLPSPDIIVSNRKNIFAIECKALNSTRKYFSQKEISELKDFSEKFGAIPFVAIRFDRIGWFFVHLEDMGFSRTNHFISLELAKEKSIKFDQIIGKYSQGFLQNPAKI